MLLKLQHRLECFLIHTFLQISILVFEIKHFIYCSKFHLLSQQNINFLSTYKFLINIPISYQHTNFLPVFSIFIKIKVWILKQCFFFSAWKRKLQYSTACRGILNIFIGDYRCPKQLHIFVYLIGHKDMNQEALSLNSILFQNSFLIHF